MTKEGKAKPAKEVFVNVCDAHVRDAPLAQLVGSLNEGAYCDVVGCESRASHIRVYAVKLP